MRSASSSRSVSRLKVVASLVAAACWLFTQSAAVQAADGKVLAGKAVTESNLLDALTPSAEGEIDVTMGSRTLKISSANTAAVANTAPAPRKKPSASLLITFETSSASLTARSKEQLGVVAGALKNDKLKDFSFDVEGHADARGNPESNKLLSQQRAESVLSYLVTAQNVPPTKLRAIGKGASEPMNAKVIAAPENRRVTIVTNTP